MTRSPKVHALQVRIPADVVPQSDEQCASKLLEVLIACIAFTALGVLFLYGLALFCETASELAQHMTQKWTRAA